jgi:hypothetical protein
MYFVAAALTVLAGLFYAASHHEIGSIGGLRCADTAAPFAIIHFTFWPAQFLRRCGVHSSASDEPRNFPA